MNDSENHAERLADLTFVLLEKCQMKMEQIARSLRLTLAEFKTIRAFHDTEVLPAGELALRLDLSSSRLTRILDGLVTKGIVHREVSDTDRRVVDVTLTEKGKGVRQQLSRTFVQAHQEMLDLLPSGEGDVVLGVMEKLKDAMDEWVND